MPFFNYIAIVIIAIDLKGKKRVMEMQSRTPKRFKSEVVVHSGLNFPNV